MNIEQQFFHHIRKQHFFEKNERLLVSFSGGGDSVALVHLLKSIQSLYHFDISLAYVNHGLREDADKEQAFVEDFAKENDLQLVVRKWEIGKSQEKGVEEAAREFRYLFLKEIIEQHAFDKVLTAHHGDDLVETTFMRLIRGSLPWRLTSLSEKRDFYSTTLLRPLLPFSKEELEEMLKEKGISYYTDSSNMELHYFRNRVRRQMLPFVKNENPLIIENILEFSKSSEYVEGFLREQATTFLSEHTEREKGVVRLNGLHQCSRSSRYIYILLILEENEIYLQKRQIEELLEHFEGKQFPKEMRLSPKLILQVRKDCLELITGHL